MSGKDLFNYIWQYGLIFLLFILIYALNKQYGPETFTILFSIFGKIMGAIMFIITNPVVQIPVFILLVYTFIKYGKNILAEER